MISTKSTNTCIYYAQFFHLEHDIVKTSTRERGLVVSTSIDISTGPTHELVQNLFQHNVQFIKNHMIQFLEEVLL